MHGYRLFNAAVRNLIDGRCPGLDLGGRVEPRHFLQKSWFGERGGNYQIISG